jgi:hypothetical protein
MSHDTLESNFPSMSTAELSEWLGEIVRRRPYGGLSHRDRELEAAAIAARAASVAPLFDPEPAPVKYYTHFRDAGMPRDEHDTFAEALKEWRKPYGANRMYANDDESEGQHGDGLTEREQGQLVDHGPPEERE